MKNFLLVLAFTGLTALCWGVYGPVLRNGQADMEGSHLRPFVCVGVAYFVIAIVAPGVLLRLYGEKGRWTSQGTFWSLLAGAAGAIGALGIILAFNNRGSPVYVMPLVFGCAPVVNTFYTIASSKGQLKPGPVFIAGLILVVAGAVTVLVFKPSPAKAIAEKPAQKPADAEKSIADEHGKPLKDATPTHGSTGSLSVKETTLVTLFVALTALCWGVYGPVLHKGQMLMQGSRLRPLICVGVSYFAIAVVVPELLLQTVGEHGQFTLDGSLWSLAGGAAGAVGALGIIMAFNFGGKPIYVMPLVFGCAPVINTGVSLALAGKAVGEIHPVFYAGLIVVVAGAVTVLIFAPKAGHGSAAKPAAKPETAEQPV
ncbi:MAG TPA: hypothetical protein VMV69_26160 [Pirellulales bacterium]|nr:hypothetical protein [Pirellulales bacterium]